MAVKVTDVVVRVLDPERARELLPSPVHLAADVARQRRRRLPLPQCKVH